MATVRRSSQVKAQNVAGLVGSPEAHLRRCIAQYSPEIATLARGAIARMRKRLPAANRLVYDNYNALGIGFTPTESAHDAIFSIVLYPRRVSLFFLKAMRSNLSDPDGLLQGSGNLVRFIPLDSPAMIDSAPVRRLMAQALAGAREAMPRTGKGRLVIRSISTRHRSRRQ
jgi:hypothetical protein